MNNLIDGYLSGPRKLRDAVAGASTKQLDAKPVPGKWSIRQVICHLADWEMAYSAWMKRVIVEENPPMWNLSPTGFAAGLAYEDRDVEEELQLIETVRQQMGRILRATGPNCWQRTADHATAGPLTLETLLSRITNHIPHHVAFIQEKLAAMAADDRVQEASEGSFPASDPPSWTGVTRP